MGGAACSSVGVSTPLAEAVAIATPLAKAVATLLAEAISAHLFLTSRQVTWPDPFPTTLVRFATYKAKKKHFYVNYYNRLFIPKHLSDQASEEQKC